MAAVTLSPSSPNVTLSGNTTAYGLIGAYYINYFPGPPDETAAVGAAIFGHAGTNFSVLNTGTILSTGTSQFDAGIVLGGVGAIRNTGTIIGPSGIFILGATAGAYAGNTGTIIAKNGDGIDIPGAGGANNSGLIIASTAGIDDQGVRGLVENFGTIIAGYGIVQGFGTGVNAGTILATGRDGVVTYGTFTNVSTAAITAASGTGIFGVFYSALYNAGRITAETGILLGVGGSFHNTGTVTASNAGVYEGLNLDPYANAPATITNAKHAVIAGASFGIRIHYASANIGNAGTIAGATAISDSGNIENSGNIKGTTIGVRLAGGTLTNSHLTEGKTALSAGGDTYLDNTGLISAKSTGILMLPGTYTYPKASLASYLYNYGTITAGAVGIAALAGKQPSFAAGIYNYGGTILAATAIAADTGIVLNTGLIGATAGAGIVFTGYGYIANSLTGTISASGAAILLQSGGTVINAGRIYGAVGGITLATGGAILNTGTIETSGFGSFTALYAASGNTDLTNDGLIYAPDGIVLQGAAYVLNEKVIDGNVYIKGRGTLINDDSMGSVTLAAAGTAINNGELDDIVFGTNTAANLLVSKANAYTNGTVNLNGGTLELTPAFERFGTLSQNLAGNATAIIIKPTAVWEFAATNAFAATIAITNDGTIVELQDDNPTIAGALSGTGTIILNYGDNLTLNGPVGAGQTIKFFPDFETISLADPTQFAATLANFTLGDTIDLTGLALTDIKSLSFSAGILTVTEKHKAAPLTFTFASPSQFPGETFTAFTDGPGTALTLTAPSKAAQSWLPPTPTLTPTLPLTLQN